jgi:hypothetical protein
MEQETYGTVSPVSKTDVLLKRIAQASAWALLATVMVAIVSGWGITQTGIIYRLTFGLINRGVADAIHRAINIPLTLFLLAHVFINIKPAVSRKSPSRKLLTGVVLGVMGAGLLALTIYMECFRLGG